jgi:hypothetical protein
MQPWDWKVAAPLEDAGSMKSLLDRTSNPAAAWEKIFTVAIEDGFISSPGLGNPFATQFAYNVRNTPSRKKNVETVCKCEANLDKFWEHIDRNLNSIVSNYQRGALQRMFEEGGGMRRTLPWEAREQSTTEKPVKDWNLHESELKPQSQIFHDISSEITGSFDKSNISVKGKEKTRGPAAEPEAAAEPAREPSPEPLRDIVLSKKSHNVLRAFFHKADSSQQHVGKVKWDEVVRALVDVGFTAEHMYGSQWQFTPSNRLGLARGISFHEPHPSNEVPLELARRMGRRLNRAYGWDGSTFTEK